MEKRKSNNWIDKHRLPIYDMERNPDEAGVSGAHRPVYQYLVEVLKCPHTWQTTRPSHKLANGS
jgi:hypothetical protein